MIYDMWDISETIHDHVTMLIVNNRNDPHDRIVTLHIVAGKENAEIKSEEEGRTRKTGEREGK